MVPLSLQQSWALQHWVQPVEPYVVPFAVRLRGRLNIDALQRSLTAVVHRHGSLRTRIAMVDGEMRQVIDEPTEQPLEIVSCTSTTAIDPEDEARTLVEEFFRRPVDFANDAPCRALLIELNEQTHVLAFTIGHMVCDGISARIFRREVWTLYADFACGRPPSLVDMPMQYADYTLWQAQELQRSAERHAAYFRTQLADAQPFRLPVENELQDVSPFSPAKAEIVWNEQLSSALLRVSLVSRTTPALVMLALYSVVLASWSGQQDLVVPFVAPGRVSSAQAGVIGFMSQYLPVRIRLADDETFLDLLKHVSGQFFAAHEHLDFGKCMFDWPQMRLGTSLNWSPGDFVTSTPADWSPQDGLPTIEPFNVTFRTPPGFRQRYDTLCYLRSTSSGIWGFIDYRADKFRAETMRRICLHLKDCAEKIAASPTTTVEHLQSLGR